MAVQKKVLVIGAGLAGLAAAEKLLDAGLAVTVVDSFPLPGGRVASFEVPVPVAGLAPGDVVEHGLHAFFQHYHALYGLMQRAGLNKPPFAGEGIYFWNPEQAHYRVEGGPLFWLIRSLGLPEGVRGARWPALTAFASLTAKLASLLKAENQTDTQSALHLLQRFDVPEAAIDSVFRPCMYSLTSLSLERLSALEMLRWMSSILPDPRIRCLQGGGSQALCMPIAEGLQKRGADFRYGVEVQSLGIDREGKPWVRMVEAPDRTGLRHVLVTDFRPASPPDRYGFDAVICSLPWEKLVALDDGSIANAAPQTWSNFKKLHNVHPLTIRLWFEHPLEGVEERYTLSSGTVFDVLRPTKEPGRDGIFLIDALVEDIERTLPELGYDHERYVEPGRAQDAVVSRVLEELEKLYPGQIAKNPLRATFVHTREGILANTPGTWALRPESHIGLDALFLAGDYTRQPYGTCMEGAVRSGQTAAQVLISGKPVTPRRAALGQVAYSCYSLFVRK